MNDNDTINLIRSKSDIVDIIGERIPLVSKGKNYFGICPFHDDENPSMSVSREKQIFTCFSCHATGNVFKFLMDYEHKSFSEVLKDLGNRAGIEVKGVKVDSKNLKFSKYYDIYNFAEKYYQNNLMTSIGKQALNYLKQRKITEKEIKKFKIGLSLNNDNDLTTLLTSKNYSLTDLNKIGLSYNDHDLYKDRIMFPLWDMNGKVIGFSGRVYKESDQSKYINTKETEIFKKGMLLYNYHNAVEEVRKSKFVIIMEGFMDVIRASTIDVNNVIALMGTALTSDGIKLIKRLSKDIVLCLDGDNPGQKAMSSIGEMLVKENFNVKVVSLPEEDDPDTYILTKGKESFNNLIENAILYSDFKLNNLKKGVNFKSIEEKTEYINKVLEETSKEKDIVKIEIILKKLAKDLDIGYNTLEKKFADINKNTSISSNIQVSNLKKKVYKNKYQKAMEQVIYFMLTNNFTIDEVENARLIFPNSKMRLLVSEINYYYKKYGVVNIADFYTYLSDKEELLTLLNDILISNYIDKITKKELNLYFDVIRENSCNLEIKRLKKMIEDTLDPLEQAKISEKIRKLRIGE